MSDTIKLEAEDSQFRSLCYSTARRIYGESLPDTVSNRLELELQGIIRNGNVTPYLMAHQVVKQMNSEGHMVTPRGSVGATFAAYCLGISEVNPLPPHYRCTLCKHSEWFNEVISYGVDLPKKGCPHCKGTMVGDGHHIPCEMFLGLSYDRPPNIDLKVPLSQTQAHKILEEQIESGQTLSAGNRDLETVLFNLDLFEDTTLNSLGLLSELTGIDPTTIPMNDAAVLSLFRSTLSLNVSPQQLRTDVATYGIPELQPVCVRTMLKELQPNTYSDLVQISGISHGSGTWEDNAHELIKTGQQRLQSVIACKDDVMLKLISWGVSRERAYHISDKVRKGHGITEEWVKELKENDIPLWFIDSCQKIKYLFPKAHAAAYAMSAVRHAFYKLYYPLEFYAVYYSVNAPDMDFELCLGGIEAVDRKLQQLEKLASPQDDKAQMLFAYQVALEMCARSMRFRQDSIEGYVIESNNRSIRIPVNG
ncbi:hypothetical protein [Paenibacillus sp. RC67]|uniref:hypothetical protein n=1 Tax=Paenibacillus sp. RC67 TaxID=3039392 RepID=UPI0024AE3062|nr:hypothetical protein [Paenibacillus sp. RC67]